MITFLLSVLFLALGYGLGYVHSSLVEADKAEFWFNWKNPLLWIITIPAFFICLYQDGWSKTKMEMKKLIKDLKENEDK